MADAALGPELGNVLGPLQWINQREDERVSVHYYIYLVAVAVAS